MASVLVLYNPPADPEAFDRHYREVHAPLAARIPGLRAYTVSEGVFAADGKAPYHLVAELSFDSMDALQAAMASPEAQAAVADMPNFAQAGATVLMVQKRSAMG
jgi:uncharacterized protein (TIGR02118 family)